MNCSIAALLAMTLVAGCGAGGGTEFGNPTEDGTTRVVSGEVESGSSANTAKGKNGGGGSCIADTVVAANAKDEETTATIDTDCSFSITLSIGKAYRLSIEKNDAVIGILHFQNYSSLFADVVMAVTSGSGAIALGRLTLSGRHALPAKEPATQTDQDGDGIADLDDDDDDNDGTDDIAEADCDLDGFHDDVDDTNDSCDSTAATARVLRVSPRHDGDFQFRARRVQADEPIRARVSCLLDADSVTATTFRVTASNDDMTCVFTVPIPGARIECDHDADPMLADTVYTATMEGVRCLNGETVQTRSWSWKTRAD